MLRLLGTKAIAKKKYSKFVGGVKEEAPKEEVSAEIVY